MLTYDSTLPSGRRQRNTLLAFSQGSADSSQKAGGLGISSCTQHACIPKCFIGLVREQFAHACHSVGTAPAIADIAGRAGRDSTEKNDVRAVWEPFKIGHCFSVDAKRPTSSRRCEVCDARVIAHDVRRRVNDRYQMTPGCPTAEIYHFACGESTHDLVRAAALASCPHDHHRGAFAKRPLDESPIVGNRPFFPPFVRERRDDDRRRLSRPSQ